MNTEINGIELSRRFFLEWGLPLIERQSQNLARRVAAVVGTGSQAVGIDDMQSRDHGWGPGFRLILNGRDFTRWGRRLSEVMAEAERPSFEWVERPRAWDSLQTGITVLSINRAMGEAVGVTRPPQRSYSWRRISEMDLYLLRHTRVLYDPYGEWSARKGAFAHAPGDIRLHWLQAEVFNVWHYGEYNFLWRMIPRADPVAAQVCLGHFFQAVMRICFLLNDDYAPYWKWLHAEFRRLPEFLEIDPLMMSLARAQGDLPEQGRLVSAITRIIRRHLVGAGFLESDDEDLLALHSRIKAQIKEKRL